MRYLDSGENDTSVRVLELRNDPLADQLELLFALSGIRLVRVLILGDSVEDGDSPPLGTFSQCDEQSIEGRRVEDEDGGIVGEGLNLGESEYGVRYDLQNEGMRMRVGIVG